VGGWLIVLEVRGRGCGSLARACQREEGRRVGLVVADED
jgi:hypothetical protein